MHSDALPSTWQQSTPARAAPGLRAGHAHLWLVSLDEPPLPHDRLAGFLDTDERARAERFRFEIHRRRFEAGRGLLRWLVAHYVGVEPALLRWRYGAHGKPALHWAQPRPSPEFNLSHSGGWVVVGLALEAPIGVDVEVAREIPELMELARTNFSTGEVREIQQLHPELQAAGFFACWTRKEAYVKALGAGLSAPLQEFEVSLDPQRPPTIRSIGGSTAAAEQWSLLGLQPAEGVWLAAAVNLVAAHWQLFRAGP